MALSTNLSPVAERAKPIWETVGSDLALTLCFLRVCFLLRNDPSRFLSAFPFDEDDVRARRGGFHFAPEARGAESLRHPLRVGRIVGGVDAHHFPVVEALGAEGEGVIEPGV